ncbi:MAG: nitrate/nitrite transporter NrtS [Gemmatimonadetes bacterium]|nr:nitrate/nitrite transporter NrtS [Gemmatimonadota bacterium]
MTAGDLHRAARVALVVGTVLVAINQGPTLLGGRVTPALAVRVALTYAVPFFVSIYAAWRSWASGRPPGHGPGCRTSPRDQMLELDRAMGRGLSHRPDADDGECRE